MKRYDKIAEKYAVDVISGSIPANKWIKLICKRHIEDLRSQNKDDFKYYFCKESAWDVCDFAEDQYHTKGKWAAKSEKIKLEPWQVFFFCCVFGWKKKGTRMRRYNEVFLLVPRKNGKSIIAAVIGLYMLVADGEFGAEVYAGATTEKQAKEVFIPAQIMARKNKEMTEMLGIDIRASNINVPATGAKFEPLIGNPGDGGSPSCAIADEVHEHKDSKLIETMMTGMGAREQPLMLYISTAGSDLTSPCYAIQNDCYKILDGTQSNDHMFPMIYGVDDGDDWSSLDVLKKANPNFGVSVLEDYLINQLNKAKNSARLQSAFKTKHLNVWVGSRDAFYNIEKWRNCENKNLKLSDFKGRRAYIGLDLASRVDIAAIEILIPTDDGGFVQFGKHYLPYEAAQNEHYIGWMREGWLDVTDGEIIDFNVIKDEILELCNMFEVVELAYDPFQATMLITELMEEGVPVVEMRPTVLNFSEPMKELDSLIRSGRIQHNGDPVFTWMLSNVTAKLDRKDNVYPNKERPENKIDGPVALIMAIGRAMQKEDNSIQSAIDNLIRATY